MCSAYVSRSLEQVWASYFVQYVVPDHYCLLAQPLVFILPARIIYQLQRQLFTL